MGQGTIWALILSGVVLAAGVYFFNVSLLGAGIATLYTVLAVFFFVAISVYIVGLIGSTNQPVSGITICTFLLAAIFLFAGRIRDMEAVRAVLLIAGIVCLSACLSGTASQNFKTALMVGGTPRAMQTGLIIAVILTSFLAAPLMVFLDQALSSVRIGFWHLRPACFRLWRKGCFFRGPLFPGTWSDWAQDSRSF